MKRFSDCLSRRHRWFFNKQEDSERTRAEFRGAIASVLGLTIEAVIPTNGQVVVVVKHWLDHTPPRYEFLAVIRQRGQLEVQGERGYLTYGHSGTVPIPLVLAYHNRK